MTTRLALSRGIRTAEDLGADADLDQAADALQIASRLEPGRPSLTFLLGMVRLGQRRVDDALTLLRQVPPSDPYYAAAQAQLRKLQR